MTIIASVGVILYLKLKFLNFEWILITCYATLKLKALFKPFRVNGEPYILTKLAKWNGQKMLIYAVMAVYKY